MFYGYEDEEWADIPGYLNYMISNFGRVWNVKHNRFIKPNLDSDGYEYICLGWNGKRNNLWVARLVALAFLSQRSNANQVNHDDGDKRYNYVENLEWATPGENIRHAVRSGLKPPSGEKPIRIIETNEFFKSIASCARSIDGFHNAISECLSGKRKSHRGYTFEYINERR